MGAAVTDDNKLDPIAAVAKFFAEIAVLARRAIIRVKGIVIEVVGGRHRIDQPAAGQCRMLAALAFAPDGQGHRLAGLPAFLGTANYTNSERDTFTTVDVRAGFTYGDAWRVEGWATNLFNAHTIAEVLPAPEFGGSFASPGARQAFGLDVTFSF